MGIVEELVEIWPNEVCDITPSLGSSSIEKLSRFLVYSKDIPAAFHLHFVNYPQVPMCHLLEYILFIWQGIRSSHAFVMSPEFFLPSILPGPVSRSVVGEWLSGHRWWIRSTKLTCLRERLGAMLGSNVMPYKCLGKISDILHLNNENNQLKRWARPPQRCSLRRPVVDLSI